MSYWGPVGPQCDIDYFAKKMQSHTEQKCLFLSNMFCSTHPSVSCNSHREWEVPFDLQKSSLFFPFVEKTTKQTGRMKDVRSGFD